MDMQRLREIVGEPDPEPQSGSAKKIGNVIVQDAYCYGLYRFNISGSVVAAALLLVLVSGAALSVTLWLFPGLPPFLQGAATVLPIIPVFIVIAKLAMRSEVRRVRAFLNDVKPRDPTEVMVYMTSEVKLGNDEGAFRLVTSHMLRNGFTGHVYRLWKKAKPRPFEPLSVPFEPIQIDESNIGFRQLVECDALTASVTEDATTSHSSNEPILPPAVRRNIRLGGGYLLVAWLVVILGFGIIESISRRTPTFLLAMAAISLFTTVFVPARSNRDLGQQWLLLPGGLLRRSARRKSAIQLDLFEAARCVMIAIQARDRNWTLHVSDGPNIGTLRVTPFELEGVLRAWCSPIPPPTVEQLSDFA